MSCRVESFRTESSGADVESPRVPDIPELSTGAMESDPAWPSFADEHPDPASAAANRTK